MADRYYLGPPLWDTSAKPRWRAPHGTVGMVDLRGPAKSGIAGGVPQGVGFFAVDGPALDSSYLLLGTSLGSSIPSDTRLAMESLLSIGTIVASDIGNTLWELLTLHSDPTGENRWKPLTPTHRGDMELHLGGHSLIKIARWNPDGPGALDTIDVFKRDYARLRTEFRAEAEIFRNTVPADRTPARRRIKHYVERHEVTFAAAKEALAVRAERKYRQVLESWRRKLRINYRQIQGGLPDEPPFDPESLFSESFNQGDSSTLGPDLTWTEIDGTWKTVNNEVTQDTSGGGNVRNARADHDMSSDDHYVQVVVTGLGSGTMRTRHGPAARLPSSGETNYHAAPYQFDDTYLMWKMIGGTPTGMGSPPGITLSLPETYMIECNGSAIKAYQAGVERRSETDTDITGNVRGGLIMLLGGGGDTPATGDNFEEADLAVGADLRPGNMDGGLQLLTGGLQ